MKVINESEQPIVAKLAQEGKVIFLKEKVAVKATKANPYYPDNKEVEMHPRIAEDGIKKGFYTAVKAKKED